MEQKLSLGVTLKPSMFNNLAWDDGQLLIYNAMRTIAGCMRVGEENAREVFETLEKDTVTYSGEKQYEVLYRYGFLVKADLNEKQQRESLYVNRFARGTVLNLIILPTEDCNFRCKYCYESFEKGAMSEEVQNSIVEYVRQNINRYSGLTVSWFGGEPLLEFGIIEKLSKQFISICKNARRAYSSSITTNGYLLTPEVFKKLLTYRVAHYQITLDGQRELHNSNRCLADGGGTFDTIVDNLINIRKNVKSQIFSIMLRCNMTAAAFDGLKTFAEFLEKEVTEGDQRFSVVLKAVGNYGGTPNFSELTHPLVERRELGALYRAFSTSRVSIKTDLYKLAFMPCGYMCYAADPNSLLIDSQGILRKCTCELDGEEMAIGRLLSDGTAEIDNEKMGRWCGNVARLNKRCDNCSYSPVCIGGGCSRRTNFHQREPACPDEKVNLLDALLLTECSVPFVRYEEVLS